ncbi:hypothetical protein swp_2749 [Shewanella piezotolerans WP3]|uniref:Uncharacterized protein n=1 Tax=Shewanella piezotolerans (strain WP3 / JCM 13877) TaxID=225849 RepID=B8CMT7_SHEPW|nr:hypothetical protein swp_2749 [Shewanella piezotolerans WP3]
MPEPRITISSNPTTCLQRFEFPLNGQTFHAIGITLREFGACYHLMLLLECLL